MDKIIRLEKNSIDMRNAECFGKIYEQYAVKMYRLAYSYIHDSHEANEVVQQIFASLWERRHTLNVNGPIENYLIRATKLSVFKYLQQQVSLESLDSEIPSVQNDNPLDQLVYKETREKVDTLMDLLPKKGQQVFRMSREEGLKNREIASRLSISEKLVEYYIGRSLKFLKENL